MRRKIRRLIILSFGICLCFWGAWKAERAGLSRLYSEYAMGTGNEVSAEAAERMTPCDPEAHFSRASVLLDVGAAKEAANEFEHAILLRPKDYHLWLLLAGVRERLGVDEGASAALTEAVRLAPYYAEPRWQLGNLLFRQGRQEEGFEQLRLAIKSDPSLAPNLFDLAWGVTRGDARLMVATLQPESDSEHLALAHFFAKHQVGDVAIEQFRGSKNTSLNDRKAFVNELLVIRRFEDAFALWALDHPSSPTSVGNVNNPGFEDSSGFNEPGFGWQLGRDVGAVKVARDPAQPREGAYSLRIDWSGDSSIAIPVISQLLLMAPNTRYSLRFSARTADLVSGGLPNVAVTDVTSKEERLIAQTPLLQQGSTPWQDYTLDFATGASTIGVTISLRRQPCGVARCPIFGHLWLDAFSLRKL